MPWLKKNPDLTNDPTYLEPRITANENKIGIFLGTGILGEMFPRLNGETDDTERLKRAIAEAVSTNKMKVVFSTPEIQLSGLVDLPTGIKFVGLGFDTRNLSQIGTVIKRTVNAVVLRSQGTSVSSGGTNNRHVTFEGIKFHGGDFSEDFIQLIALNSSRFVDCHFTASGGRHILMHEVMDSRFTDCNFEWGGTTDGTVPMLELKSESGYEYTNQIFFTGCRFESYRGTALATTGNNTNELFLTNCKFESLASNQKHMKLHGVNAVYLDGVNICSRGTSGSTLYSQLEIKDSAGIFGTLFLEHTGTIDTNAAKIDRFVDIINSSDIDLMVYVYQNGNNVISPSVVMLDGATLDKTVSIRGRIRNNTNSKTICNKNIYDIALNGDFNFRTNTFFNNYAYHPALLSSAPYGREGSRYVDTSVTPNCTRTYSNGSWKRTGHASAAPTSGSWNTGDIIYNSAPAAGGKVGWVCTSPGSPGTWKPFGTIDA